LRKLQEDLTIKTTAIGISKRSSGDISNVIIKGNKPLSTDIGELVFALLYQKESETNLGWFASNCRIKSIVGRNEAVSRINLSLNFDKYGNFKMYLQKACLNVISLLSFLEYILSGEFFKLTEISPTSRDLEI
jgi:hypothetical protein